MATYKEIHGTVIETVTSDPSNPVNGQVWYNSTDQVLKGFTSNPAGAWSTGGNLNTGKGNVMGAGIQTAALKFGGRSPDVANTEQYDGTSWTEVADLNSVRRNSGSSGTTTAALAFGGFTTPPSSNGPSALNEQWDGSSWTEVADLNTERYGMGSVGTTTASLSSGGLDATGQVAINESWNG